MYKAPPLADFPLLRSSRAPPTCPLQAGPAGQPAPPRSLPDQGRQPQVIALGPARAPGEALAACPVGPRPERDPRSAAPEPRHAAHRPTVPGPLPAWASREATRLTVQGRGGGGEPQKGTQNPACRCVPLGRSPGGASTTWPQKPPGSRGGGQEMLTKLCPALCPPPSLTNPFSPNPPFKPSPCDPLPRICVSVAWAGGEGSWRWLPLEGWRLTWCALGCPSSW